ncbi:DUF357 domain-containing protein [Methanofollis aquaemaris]|uniref:DUF357 domain-containing protein n=1 Tax=Methanofollis aquaemaris TaxID=126734 RepID=UPI00223EB55D|nr:DUF357 domain-containing protein [Methanofollis aquaemaris]
MTLPLRDALDADLSAVSPASPEGSALAEVCACVLRMVSSYLSDGTVFAGEGDLVNAHASFAYAYGWLDAGAFLGLYHGRSVPGDYDFSTSTGPDLRAHLEEKTARYERLLTEAVGSISPAPDAETPMYRTACQVADAGRVALGRGQECAADLRLEEALGWYSYGYGWLDAGVQAGIFVILGRRDIFTV